MKIEIYSILRRVSPQVNNAKTLEEAREIVKVCVESSGINDSDKQKMLSEFSGIKTLKRFLEYFYNALLKYEGDGVI